MHDRDCVYRVFATKVNKRAPIGEHASPKPAMQVQCPNTILPLFFATTQDLTGSTESFWEWRTEAITRYESESGRALISLTQPLATYL